MNLQQLDNIASNLDEVRRSLFNILRLGGLCQDGNHVVTEAAMTLERTAIQLCGARSLQTIAEEEPPPAEEYDDRADVAWLQEQIDCLRGRQGFDAAIAEERRLSAENRLFASWVERERAKGRPE